MEIVQAIIYTSRYILKNGNFDLYYFMTMAIVILLLLRKEYKKYINTILLSAGVLIFIEICSYIFSGIESDLVDAVLTISKLLICITLMLVTKDYFLKLDIRKLAYCVAGIHTLETIIALFCVNNVWWKLNDIENGLNKTRLQLLYMEPSELSMCSALIIILLLYAYEMEGFRWTDILCYIIFCFDMYLSAGLGGIISISMAIGIVLLLKLIRLAFSKKRYYYLLIIPLFAITIYSVIYSIDIPMLIRIRLMLSGEFAADSSTSWRLWVPLQSIGPILRETNFMGVGLGNFNSTYAAQMMSKILPSANWFPNSFLYFVAEGGIWAIGLLIIGIGYLGYRAIKTHCFSLLILFLFITIYQIPGGYFTNPLNWICYGVILAYVPSAEDRINRGRLELHQVTIAAITSVKLKETILAMKYSMKSIKFADAVFISDSRPDNLPRNIRFIEVDAIDSIDKYNQIVLFDLYQYIKTGYVLIVHWDGFVVNPFMWRGEFLHYDYIGAPWPEELGFHDVEGNVCRVGNGVSLRSKRMLEFSAKMKPEWDHENEDLFLCCNKRHLLEKEGLTIAPISTASFFSHERIVPEIRGIKPFMFHQWEGNNAQYPRMESGICEKCKKQLIKILIWTGLWNWHLRKQGKLK